MFPIDSLLEEYLAGPQLLAEAVAGMSGDQLTARPVEGRWSTLEVVCHLVDSDAVHACRMKWVIAECGPPLPNSDETRWIERLPCHARSAAEEIELLSLQRRQMARILHATPPEAFARTGNHSEEGAVTLATLLERAVRHLPHHLPFIAEKRAALGV
ncbi:putative metal-dependent hydrolase YfiT [Pseudobythopirellula maris]|uniref:Putative metal-dependent hydrolase YfiT n=1 Tax=Pseudobythopirellula maris TaxID=2527991 RepID=A0A5C5ZQ62_9BACT|nr:DinB family protein [Pseudobythopirellula maris]TWT88951.1 putative metal-dependent hydrolase YfiT [Pseudobythopirellula maris]